MRRGRGERWVEGVFGLHARHAGNGVGYDSICASGDHANTLHWIKNTGDVKDGDLILVDAGVEVDSLFTADVTRTLPVNGTYSPAQREVYEAVLAAQEAGLAAAKPGAAISSPASSRQAWSRSGPTIGSAAIQSGGGGGPRRRPARRRSRRWAATAPR